MRSASGCPQDCSAGKLIYPVRRDRGSGARILVQPRNHFKPHHETASILCPGSLQFAILAMMISPPIFVFT